VIALVAFLAFIVVVEALVGTKLARDLKESEEKRERLVSIPGLEDALDPPAPEKKKSSKEKPKAKVSKKPTPEDAIAPEMLEGLSPLQRSEVLKDYIFWTKR
jgi:hypothetical protein